MDKFISYITLIKVILCCGLPIVSSIRQFSDNVKVQTKLMDDGVCSSMVQTQNYPCREHQVTTQDGYILSLQNIPFGRLDNSSGERPPVLLQHGLTMDAVSWVLSPPEEALAFVLADNGFDVWIVSTRGTKYSKGHLSLTTDDADYWNWSWDELAAYDLPATIQYVHNQTGQNLHYVGHSLGTLTVLAALSKGQFVDKLRSTALLCPIAYVGHITSILFGAAAKLHIPEAMRWLKIHALDVKSTPVINILLKLCDLKGIDCSDILTAIAGPNCCLNSSTDNRLFEYELQPTSIKNMVHLAQMVRDDTIQMYDYGNEEDNNKNYGQATPPSYNMSHIPSNIPLFLAHGGADGLSVPTDVNMLLDGLRDREADKLVVEYTEEYGHTDYVFGYNAREIVYDPMIAFFRHN